MFSTKLSGGEELARNLNALPDAVKKTALLKILRVAAEPIRARAASAAPIGSGEKEYAGHAIGHLADSIKISSTNRVDKITAGRLGELDENQAAVAIGPDADHFYGLFIEYGTKRIPTARPFLRPAFDTSSSTSLALIQSGIWRALEAANKPPKGGTP